MSSFDLINKWGALRSRSYAPKAYLNGQLDNCDRFCVELTAEVLTIGRGEDAALQVNDDGVSRRHCAIWPEQGGHHIRDLSSKNGTWVNEWPVREGPLCDGDHIRVGSFCLVYGHTPIGRQLQVGDRLGVPSIGATTMPLPQIAVHAPRKESRPVAA